MIREQVSKDDLLIESMRVFRHSISLHSVGNPSSIKEDEGDLPNQNLKVLDKPSPRADL